MRHSSGGHNFGDRPEAATAAGCILLAAIGTASQYTDLTSCRNQAMSARGSPGSAGRPDRSRSQASSLIKNASISQANAWAG